jgi:hypothetical protein
MGFFFVVVFFLLISFGLVGVPFLILLDRIVSGYVHIFVRVLIVLVLLVCFNLLVVPLRFFSSAEVKKMWIHIFTPPLRLHGIVFN